MNIKDEIDLKLRELRDLAEKNGFTIAADAQIGEHQISIRAGEITTAIGMQVMAIFDTLTTFRDDKRKAQFEEHLKKLASQTATEAIIKN